MLSKVLPSGIRFTFRCYGKGRNRMPFKAWSMGETGMASTVSNFLRTSDKFHFNPFEWQMKVSPRQIHCHLDKHVVNQEEAKKILSVQVYLHYLRIFQQSINKDLGLKPGESSERRNSGEFEDPLAKGSCGHHATSRNNYSANDSLIRSAGKNVNIEKSNILLAGPTGSGKTLLARSLSKFLNVPLVVCDCTSLTQAGYVGEDVESILWRLLEESELDLNQAERGIVFLDEVDKIQHATLPSNRMRDVGGEGVQQALLKIIEGTTVKVPMKTNGRSLQETVSIDTTNILFIAAGAFNGITEIVRNRLQKKSIGFSCNLSSSESDSSSYSMAIPSILCDKSIDTENYLLGNIQAPDLIDYGIIPEFVGRFPVIAALRHLDQSSLMKILFQPDNCLLAQLETQFSFNQCKLSVTDSAIEAIAKRAMNDKTGARGLRSILENVLLNARYDVPNSNICEVKITAEVISEKCPPEYVYSP